MCATSIGSTFSHSPVPGERKSGIPEGTEMPAPVSATTELGLADQLDQPVEVFAHRLCIAMVYTRQALPTGR